MMWFLYSFLSSSQEIVLEPCSVSPLGPLSRRLFCLKSSGLPFNISNKEATRCTKKKGFWLILLLLNIAGIILLNGWILFYKIHDAEIINKVLEKIMKEGGHRPWTIIIFMVPGSAAIIKNWVYITTLGDETFLSNFSDFLTTFSVKLKELLSMGMMKTLVPHSSNGDH